MNQCDGCNAGMALDPNSFIHVDDKGKLHMVCTKRRYEKKPLPVRHWPDAAIKCDKCGEIIQAGWPIYGEDESLCEDCKDEMEM